MSKTQLMRVDKNFKKLVENISKENNLSQTEATRELFNAISGRSLFEGKKRQREKRRNIFG